MYAIITKYGNTLYGWTRSWPICLYIAKFQFALSLSFFRSFKSNALQEVPLVVLGERVPVGMREEHRPGVVSFSWNYTLRVEIEAAELKN